MIGDLDCRDLSLIYREDNGKIADLLRRCDEVISDEGVDKESLRIVLAGRMAAVSFAVAEIRSYFAPDASWLGDYRFSECSEDTDPDKLVELGEDVLDKLINSNFNHLIEILLYRNDDKKTVSTVILAEKDQATKDLYSVDYKTKLYITDRTVLTLLIDGIRYTLSLRDHGFLTGIYAVGLRVNDNQTELCFQNVQDESDFKYVALQL